MSTRRPSPELAAASTWLRCGWAASPFALHDARRVPVDEQLPPILAPEHHGEPGVSSLRYDSDLLARKPSTDVLVVGSASRR